MKKKKKKEKKKKKIKRQKKKGKKKNCLWVISDDLFDYYPFGAIYFSFSLSLLENLKWNPNPSWL